LYAVRRDWSTNTLVVGPEEALAARRVTLRDCSWVAGEPPKDVARVTAKVRYGSSEQPALLECTGTAAEVLFDDDVRAPAPGQGLVAYDGDEVLGGGTISRAA
jgi:tRNA-specific 2-thiouridylase